MVTGSHCAQLQLHLCKEYDGHGSRALIQIHMPWNKVQG